MEMTFFSIMYNVVCMVCCVFQAINLANKSRMENSSGIFQISTCQSN
jgi:hypothetical protein